MRSFSFVLFGLVASPAALAAHPHKSVRAPEGCEMSELKTTGNTARWSVPCHMHGGTQTGTGEVPAK